MSENTLNASPDLYAQEFINLRFAQFQKLVLRVKKLILEIVQYYLSTFYPTDFESARICRNIQDAKTENNEALMLESYKDFLAFLPIRLRSGVQGKNLFVQPTETELLVDLAHFYENDLTKIKAENEVAFTRDDVTGMSPHDILLLADHILDQADSTPPNNNDVNLNM